MTTKVLFVDDDIKVLRGLRRTMLLMDDQIESRFAESGQEALGIMAEEAIDIVISDMRMPEMDGAELLKIIKKRWPGSIRIIMSGQSGKEHTLKALGLSHQYLAKPCNSEHLKEIVANFNAGRAHFSNKELTRTIASISSLPSQPKLYSQITEELKKENVSMKTIGKIVAQDSGMTAQILRLVNSAYFGITNKVSNAGLAVNLLGADLVKTLVLTLKIFESEELAQDIIDTQTLLEHSAAVASKCKDLVNALELPHLMEDTVTAAMLHDIGKLILAANFPEKYREIHKRTSEDRSLSSSTLEMEVLGVTHGDVGAYLFRIWGLPVDVVTAIQEHCGLIKRKNSMITSAIILNVADAFVPSDSNKVLTEPVKYIDFDYLASVHGGEELIGLINKIQG